VHQVGFSIQWLSRCAVSKTKTKKEYSFVSLHRQPMYTKTYFLLIFASDLNSPQRHFCATLNILYCWQWRVAQHHTQNALSCFNGNSGYLNMPQYYVTCTLLILSLLNCATVWHVNVEENVDVPTVLKTEATGSSSRCRDRNFAYQLYDSVRGN
jgi:hypothetical protein